MKKSDKNSSKFLNNSFWMIIGRIYQMFLSLIIGSLTARYLGPSNYGILNYGLSYINILNVICSLGFEGVIVKRIVNGDDESELIGTTIFLRLVVSILSIFGLILFFNVVVIDHLTKFVAIIQSISLLFNIYEIIELWLQAKMLSKYAVFARGLASTIVGIWKLLLLYLNVSVSFFAFSVVIESLVIFVFLIFSYFKLKGSYPKINKRNSRLLLKDGSQFLLSSICIIIYTRMDKIMLGYFIGNDVVGIYSSALIISELWQFVPMAIINSSRPLLLEFKKLSNNKYKDKMIFLYSLIIVMGLLVGLFMIFFGKLIILILYGKDYLNAYPLLCILIWASSFGVIGSVRTTWLITENKERYMKYFVLFGAIVNLVLNVILIKAFGSIGVAVATLVAQFVVSIVAPYIFVETRESTIHIFRACNFIKIFKKNNVKELIISFLKKNK